MATRPAPGAGRPRAWRPSHALTVPLLPLVACLIACALPADALWPAPEAQTPGRHTYCLSRHLEWKAESGFSSDILAAGFERYQAIIKAMPLGLGQDPEGGEPAQLARFDAGGRDGVAAEGGEGAGPEGRRCRVIHTIEVSVTSSDQSLTLETRESYTLDVEAPSVTVQANSVYGALRALETFSQLLRRRALLPGSALEAAVPPEAAWPAQGQQQQGGARSSHQADEWRAEAAPAPQPTAGRHRHSTVLLVDQVDLYDAPRFRYRGLLLDTARHFLPVSVLKAHLDAMAMVKMNCLHWHLTDDQSFPWASEELPQLAERGAFAPEAVYTPADIKEVVEYARFRGIRVIPELDTPGHTLSWGKSYPDLLTRCYDPASSGGAAAGEPQPSGRLGPMNPARNETYGFLWRLLREAARLWPDPYIHLGGDEVDTACWQSNPEVRAFAEAQGWKGDYGGRLQAYHMEQVIRLAGSAGKSPIVWQESFDQGVPLPPGTRVQVWKWWRDSTSAGGAAAVTAAGAPSGGEAGVLRSSRGEGAGDGLAAARRLAAQRPDGAAAQQLQQQQAAAAKPAATAAPSCALGQGCAGRGFQAEEAWKAELQAVTGAGYDAILSAPWYLNLGCYAGEDWKGYYAVDPHDFGGSTEQRERVLGGCAAAWGEFIDAVNSVNRVWPRAAAVAERLWSPAARTDLGDAADRLADLRCRMLSRGIAAQSMGPGFCPGELCTRL